MYNDPPIICHHNFSQCNLDAKRFPHTVRFVHPHRNTAWGSFSQVASILDALKLLYDRPCPPDWFAVISGSDYPIRRSADVLAELATSPYDGYVHHELIVEGARERPWHELCVERYLRRHLQVRYPNRRLHFNTAHVALPGRISHLLLPFSRDFQCWAGEGWFTANHRCAEALLDRRRIHRRLSRAYATVPVPSESYFATVLCNEKALKLANDCKRYIDWSAGGAHPKTLDLTDLTKLKKSEAHFARKFTMADSRALLDTLDAWTA
jgi:hypothetical protein